MSVNIYVGNLPYTYTSSDLEELFGGQGHVASAPVTFRSAGMDVPRNSRSLFR